VDNNCILFICDINELNRERRGYFNGFSKITNTVCISDFNSNKIENINKLIYNDINPRLILQPEASPRLPHGLLKTKVPTACFQIDTYSGTDKRIKWSMLFDYTFVFHPGFEQFFQKAGHPRAICLPHAVEVDLFMKPEPERIYDVGWVGRLEGKHYSVRRRCIEQLKSYFKMNEVNRKYTPEEMAIIYKKSKIVVNISRDNYLEDANLRCFEVMASGALLITSKYTELSRIGFIEGIHYIGYEKEEEIPELVKFYLKLKSQRNKISRAARSLVMQHHTYDSRVKTIIDILDQDKGKLFAPARYWDNAQVHATYLHYFAKHLMLDAAFQELREIRGISRSLAWSMIPTVGKALIQALKLSL
jgi:hypothetical protein